MIKLITFFVISVTSFTSMAYKLNPNEFAENGKFGYPTSKNINGKIHYENFNTIDYLINNKLWNNTAKSLFNFDPSKSLKEAKFSYGKDLIDELIQNKKLPDIEKWPISSAGLSLVLDGKKYAENLVTQKEKKENKKFKGVRVAEKISDWKKSTSKSSGATFAYLDDKQAGKTTYTGTGAIIFPFESIKNSSARFFQSTFIPSLSWKFKEIRKNDDSDDIEELKFSGGYSIFQTRGKNLRTIEYIFNPFILTDFDFDGRVYGVESTASFNYQNGGFEIGSYRKLTIDSNAAYRLDIIPKLQYSKVDSPSAFINREDGDEEIAVGADFSISFKPFGKDKSWEIVGVYSFLKALNGEEKMVESTKLKTLYWLNKNVAISGAFEEGEMPLTKKEIDQLTFGLEFEF